MPVEAIKPPTSSTSTSNLTTAGRPLMSSTVPITIITAMENSIHDSIGFLKKY